jgi:hypothetical protein
VQTYGDQLRIFAGDEDVNGNIRSALTAANIDILEMRQVQPRMEEAFISLIGSQHSAVSSKPDLHEEEYEK